MQLLRMFAVFRLICLQNRFAAIIIVTLMLLSPRAFSRSFVAFEHSPEVEHYTTESLMQLEEKNSKLKLMGENILLESKIQNILREYYNAKLVESLHGDTGPICGQKNIPHSDYSEFESANIAKLQISVVGLFFSFVLLYKSGHARKSAYRTKKLGSAYSILNVLVYIFVVVIMTTHPKIHNIIFGCTSWVELFPVDNALCAVHLNILAASLLPLLIALTRYTESSIIYSGALNNKNRQRRFMSLAGATVSVLGIIGSLASIYSILPE